MPVMAKDQTGRDAMSNLLRFLHRPTPADFYPLHAAATARRSDNEMQLAPRYRRVLVLLSQGATPQEVGQHLGLKPITTWGYMEDIFIKNAGLRQQLAAYALTILEKKAIPK